MPTILRTDGFRFFFYSDEGDPLEPPHIHVSAGEKTAKFWLDPVELVSSKRVRNHEIAALHVLVERNRDTLLEAWNAYFHS